MSETNVDHGPSRVGATIAILAATIAVGLVADHPAQHRAIAIELGGLLAIAVGVSAGRRGFSISKAVIKLVGLATIGAALIVGTATPTGITERLEFLPGAFGIAILAWGLLPATTAGSRRRVAAGLGAVVASILASGIMHGTEALALLGAFAATVVAWDAAEQAISLGEQVGRTASTASVEFVHVGGTAAVGIAGIYIARLVHGFDVTDIPLAGLMLLLAAALVLALALNTR